MAVAITWKEQQIGFPHTRFYGRDHEITGKKGFQKFSWWWKSMVTSQDILILIFLQCRGSNFRFCHLFCHWSVTFLLYLFRPNLCWAVLCFPYLNRHCRPALRYPWVTSDLVQYKPVWPVCMGTIYNPLPLVSHERDQTLIAGSLLEKLPIA